MPTICHRCGRIGHLQGSCSFLIPDDEDIDLPYGEWLTATTKPSHLLWSSENANLTLARPAEVHPVPGTHSELEMMTSMTTNGLQVFGQVCAIDSGEDDVDIIAMHMISRPHLAKGQHVQQTISNLGMDINTRRQNLETYNSSPSLATIYHAIDIYEPSTHLYPNPVSPKLP